MRPVCHLGSANPTCDITVGDTLTYWSETGPILDNPVPVPIHSEQLRVGETGDLFAVDAFLLVPQQTGLVESDALVSGEEEERGSSKAMRSCLGRKKREARRKRCARVWGGGREKRTREDMSFRLGFFK